MLSSPCALRPAANCRCLTRSASLYLQRSSSCWESSHASSTAACTRTFVKTTVHTLTYTSQPESRPACNSHVEGVDSDLVSLFRNQIAENLLASRETEEVVQGLVECVRW
eukprot:3466923-Rhodomonas_salina.1